MEHALRILLFYVEKLFPADPKTLKNPQIMDQKTGGGNVRLGTAHLALGVVTLLAAAGAMLLRGAVVRDYEVEAFRDAAQTFLLWALLYLAASGLVHLSLGMAMRRCPDRLKSAGLPLAAAHLVVLITTLRIAMRQPMSPVFMAGLEATIAALVGVALLTLGLIFFHAWREFRRRHEDSDEAVLSKIYQWPLWSLLLVTAFLTAVSLARLDGSTLARMNS